MKLKAIFISLLLIIKLKICFFYAFKISKKWHVTARGQETPSPMQNKKTGFFGTPKNIRSHCIGLGVNRDYTIKISFLKFKINYYFKNL